jgi:dolichol-phosphate mannosyltransferase
MESYRPEMKKTIVIIPTYNEVENIASVAAAVLASPGDIEAVVVDDNSPDGTAEAVRRLSLQDPRVHLLLRTGRRGRGLAGREGFLWALDHGADCIVEMDGDGSHNPADIPRFIAAAASGAAVVVGSRFLPGGGVMGRGGWRDSISLLARSYLRLVLGIRISDPTSGYRLFTRTALEAIDPATLTAVDPFTVAEVLYRCHRSRLPIVEIPIVFRDREKGESKLRASILLKYFFRVLLLRLRPGIATKAQRHEVNMEKSK